LKKNKRDSDAIITNNIVFGHYYHRLKELALSMFEWINLPDSVDSRFMEDCLFRDGFCAFFKDEVMGYLCLKTMIGGELDVYNIPTSRTVYASNGYNRILNKDNSILIFNNMIHTNSVTDIKMFARRLYECDRTIDVNVKAQKTPVMITCDETQRLTMKNLYAQYEGNEPFIFGGKDLDLKKVQALTTGAPYVADKVHETKMQIWNEAMTYLGISNVSMIKRERLITDEVSRNMGAVVMSRYSRLNERKEACKKINTMFGLNIDVEYRRDIQAYDNEELAPTTMEEGNVNE